jgi:hypothetical protein
MFIKNQTFNDEETLLEILFDFELGTATEIIKEKQQQVEEDLKENKAYHDYIATLSDEEDRLEVETEERNIRVAEYLMEDFESFKVEKGRLYGVKGKEQTLLSEIDI